MQPGPFNNRDKKLYKNIADILGNIREAKKADKDYDGDGKVESGTAEWKGSRDRAIKKAMATRNEEVEELDELKAGTYYKAHKRAHQEKISADDEAAMGTPGAAEDSKKRARQMKKFMKAAASRSEDGKTRKEEVEHLDEKKKDKKAKKDYDGDGKIETGTQEWRGSVDKAIKKAIASRGGN